MNAQDADDRTVVVVLDPEFGDRITSVKQTHRLWAIDSPKNRAAWSSVDSAYANSAIFRSTPDASPDQHLIDALADIEDHFGPDSSNVPYERLRVMGLSLSDELKRRLSDEGPANFECCANGFEASRLRM